MKVLKAKLKNFCQHKDLTVNFSPWLTAVVGRNGAGKSNLLKALYWSLSNDHKRNAGNRADNVCQLADPSEESYVDLDFEHDGLRMSVRRGLRPDSKCLRIAGGPKITKDADIKQELEKILGVSYGLLDDYIFIDQWRMADFLSGSPAARARSLQVLFGIDKAESCWNTLGEAAVSLPTIVLVDDPDQVKMSVHQARQQEAELIRDLLRFSDIPSDYAPENDPALAVVRSYQRRLELSNESECVSSRHRELTADLEDCRRDLDRESASLESLRSQASHVATELANLNRSAAAAREYDMAVRQWSQLQTEKASVEQSIRNMPVPSKPELYVNEDYLPFQEGLRAQEYELSRCESFLATFAAGRPECPTCLRAADNLQTVVLDFQRRVPELRQAIQSARHCWAVSRAYDSSAVQFENTVAALRHSWERLDRMIAQVQVPQAPAKLTAAIAVELDALATTHHDLARKIPNQERLVNQFRQAAARVEGELQGVARRLDEIAKQLASGLASKEEADRADAEFSSRKVRHQERQTLSADLADVRRRLEHLREREREIESAQRRGLQVNRLREIFNSARDVVHRDNLPRLISQKYLEVLETEINQTLDLLDAPFRVESRDGLNFMTLFRDGRKMPAERLSGGEKAVFAMAFRIVINSTFAREVGLLCLDEPTAGLDESNLSCLETAINRLRDLSHERGLQVILVTHEKLLAHLFDEVVRL